MLTKERRSAIAVLVGERGAVDVKELTTRFGVTNETVRKDLIALEQEGLIERTHGGALRADYSGDGVHVKAAPGGRKGSTCNRFPAG